MSYVPLFPTHNLLILNSVSPKNACQIALKFAAIIAFGVGVPFPGKSWFCLFQASQMFAYFSYSCKLTNFQSSVLK